MKTTNIQLINQVNLLKKQLNTFTIPSKMIKNESEMATSRSIKDKISNLGESIGNLSTRILNDNQATYRSAVNQNHILNSMRSIV